MSAANFLKNVASKAYSHPVGRRAIQGAGAGAVANVALGDKDQSIAERATKGAIGGGIVGGAAGAAHKAYKAKSLGTPSNPAVLPAKVKPKSTPPGKPDVNADFRKVAFWKGFKKLSNERFVTHHDVNLIRNWVDKIVKEDRLSRPQHMTSQEIKDVAQQAIAMETGRLESRLRASEIQATHPDSKLKASVGPGVFGAMLTGIPIGLMTGKPKPALTGAFIGGLTSGLVAAARHDPAQHAEKHRGMIPGLKADVDNFEKKPVLKLVAHDIANGYYDDDEEDDE